VKSSGEHGNDLSGFVECWEILVAAQIAASQEGRSSMKLRSYLVILGKYWE
jgi:hypothetical protein